MSSEPSREVLVATLNELAYLLIPPERLAIEETKLGDGGFGEVCLATLDGLSRSPRKVAVKELRLPLIMRHRVAFRLARELKIWAKVKHPNILELIGYHLSADCGCAQFVSTYMVNGNVMQYIQLNATSVAVRLKFVQDIAKGLKYLHDSSPPICHGDLKPANVLVNESLDAVLCDFGLSSFICESGAASGLTTSKSIRGSTRYMSPELLLGEQSNHTLQSDVWAWGCTAFEIMTESIPYSKITNDFAVILEMYKQAPPGSVDALGSLILSTTDDPACHAGVPLLRSIIHQCWDFDPQGRPSSSSILHRISQGYGARLGSSSRPREDQEEGISSLRMEDSVNAFQRVVHSSRVHSLRGESEPSSSGMCKNCKNRPKLKSYTYCSQACADDARGSAQKREGNAFHLTLVTTNNNTYISIAKRFQERWDDPVFAPPQIEAIYQINTSKKYENRFHDAVNAVRRLGGLTTKSAFYGGLCICDLGVPQFGSDQPCSLGSCSICIVIRNCFDALEFKFPHHTGELGDGIYANLNPARANRFTNRKPHHRIRAMILCSIIHLDESVQGDKKKYSAFIEDTGRVFCAESDVILPRQLILYKDPELKIILQ